MMENRLKDLGETVEKFNETAPKVIRNNSQAKGPNLDDTLESHKGTDEATLCCMCNCNIEESFR